MLTITYYHAFWKLILSAESIILLAIVLIYGAILVIAFDDIVRSWKVKREDKL
jgi:hypothetical protein